MKIVSKSLAETKKFVQEFLTNLKPESSDLKATILLLEGDLGSGKTTFTQFLAQLLGVKEPVTSPTFVILKKYTIKHSFFKKLIHIDAYRLDGGKELERLGWDELISEPANLIVVEWPEKVADIWKSDEKKILFKFIDQNIRSLEIKWLKTTTKPK